MPLLHGFTASRLIFVALIPLAVFTASSAQARDVSAGERHGHVRTWWPNGHLKTDAYYNHDVLIGEYDTFYSSGAPYERRHYVRGHEEGRQQSWTESGELYLNYDVRHGRRYGLVNAAPCMEVGGAS